MQRRRAAAIFCLHSGLWKRELDVSSCVLGCIREGVGCLSCSGFSVQVFLLSCGLNDMSTTWHLAAPAAAIGLALSCSSTIEFSSAEIEGLRQCDAFHLDATATCYARDRLLTCSSTVVGGPGPFCVEAACLSLGYADLDRCASSLGPKVDAAAECVRACGAAMEACFGPVLVSLSGCQTACSTTSTPCRRACDASYVDGSEVCLTARATCSNRCPERKGEE
jgi:hypothetical protein